MNDKEFKRRFGMRVKALREQRGLTQEELAPQVDLSPHQISAIERGVSGTKLVAAQRLALALGVDFIELFEWIPRRKLSADEERKASAVSKFHLLISSGKPATFDDVAEILNSLKMR